MSAQPASRTPLESVTAAATAGTSGSGARLEALAQQVGEIFLGKDNAIRQCLACLLAGGHLLIEDMPGVGKTTLAQALSISLGLKFARVQFTSDLLPADVIGVTVFERGQGSGPDGAAGRFVFHHGPVFSQVLLADEVNRATPKTQSALLEAMEERQVSVDGNTRPLPEPFFVIATQNPFHQVGTYPLPESQLDRFLMCIELGYPDHRAERALLEGQDRRSLLRELATVITPAQLVELQREVARVFVSPALLDYIQALVAATRSSPLLSEGLSPRGALALLHAARAWALLARRNHVLPEDVQAIWVPVVNHRLRGAHANGARGGNRELAAQVLATVAIP